VSGVRIAKNGHKGCIQSHILALQMAKLNNWKTVAIFEDDARLKVLPEVFKNMINKAMSHKWDIIVLHGANQQEKEKIDDDLYYLKQSTQSTGYIIKLSYYDKLINLYEWANPLLEQTKVHWVYAPDQIWKQYQEKDNWYYFVTRIGKQRPGYSDIGGQYVSLDC
jgi:GR25 family glycosyltransferase involved in LPS biosynthesis